MESAGRVAPIRGQLAMFAVVGAACTAVYLVGFLILAGRLPTQLANGLALLLSAVVNTAANRRLTFGIVGRARAVQDHVQGVAVFAVGLVITSGSLAILASRHPSPSVALQGVVLIFATAAATVVRFALLRNWVFATRTRRLGQREPSLR